MATDTETEDDKVDWQWSTAATWVCVGIAVVAFWIFEGQWSLWRSVLLVGLSFASFTVGCVAAFLFTSYGEETPTVGKVRDWLIGGLAGLAIVKFATLKGLLLTFASGPGPKEFALTVGVSITFAGLGFFFMFFQRELILNVLLAESRARRGRVEGTRQAGLVTQRLLTGLPPSLLSGIDDIDDLVKTHKPEAEKLRKLLYSDDVVKFLAESEEAVRSGATLDWDVVSKAANLHYYRTYYEKDGDKDIQEKRAAEWILRALLMNPSHGDLTAKYADVLGMMGSHYEAVAVLERLRESAESPAYVEQWLGYFLLHLPNREDDSIRYSEDYHRRYPDECDALFIAACGYAQKHCRELRTVEASQSADSENRRMALLRLAEALNHEPEYAATVRTVWLEPGESFECFSKDQEFRSLVGLDNDEDGG